MFNVRFLPITSQNIRHGPTMPGRGGSFAPAVQWNGHAQSFRAFWIAGDWRESWETVTSRRRLDHLGERLR
jgi:hypothetical protein